MDASDERPKKGRGEDRGRRAAGRVIAGRAASAARSAASATSRALRVTVISTVRVSRAAVGGTGRATRASAARIRRVTSAEGAGQSGLGRLIELNGVNAIGDTLLTIALADTLFFSVATAEARDRVALYLLLTMAPFAVVAPIVGPFLDRFRHGRRWAIGTTTAVRAFLTWVMAGAVIEGEVWLYPAAFGCLVASRAFAVTRAAAVPRVLPGRVPPVTANSRLSLAAVAGAAVAAPLGIGLSAIGSDWTLRLTFLVYVGATVVAILLPPAVDSTAGERTASLRDDTPKPGGVRAHRVGAAAVRALRANTALRGFSGFLTMFVAFVLRDQPVANLDDTVAIGLLAAAAWLGGTAGTSIGATVRTTNPDRTSLVLVGAAAFAAVLTAVFWGLATALLVGFMAGFGQQLGRLTLDAVVQRDVPDEFRTSAFARSETLLQLAWVVGGGLGIVLPLVPALGFGLAAALLLGGLAAAIRSRPAHSDQRAPAAR